MPVVGGVTSLCISLLLCSISQQQPFVETNLEAVFLSFLGSFPFCAGLFPFSFLESRAAFHGLLCLTHALEGWTAEDSHLV